MKILILGAGQVGSTLTEHLVHEKNDITVIDLDNDRLSALQDRLDIRTLSGNASFPNLLYQAGAEETDILVAVTSSDETNMVACQIAASLFNIPTKIARIRALPYLAHDELFRPESIPIDVLISPEQLVTEQIKRLIENPDAFQVKNFANKKVQLIGVVAKGNSPLMGKDLRDLPKILPSIDARVVAIVRDKQSITPRGNTEIRPDDEIFFLSDRRHVRSVMSLFRELTPPQKRIIIAGGGHVGARLALSLEHHMYVKVIEHNQHKAEQLSAQLDNGIVLCGDASDSELLASENIENTDIYCAVTNSDECNIMSSTLCKKMGVQKAIALINRPSYVDIIEDGLIDIAVSPQLTTIGTLLAYIRKGDIVNVHSLRRGAAEALEVIVHGSNKTSKVVGKTIQEIALPEGSVIGTVVRGETVYMGHHDIRIEENDHIIVFCADRSKIYEVEELFQADLSSF